MIAAPPELSPRPVDVWPPVPVAVVASTWRQLAFLDCDVESTGEQAPQGERGGLFVMSPAFPGRAAYLKPLKILTGDFAGIAAREKIAADLAHDLRVHVPPAVLAFRKNGPPGEQRRVMLSLRVSAAQSEWSDVKFRMARRIPYTGRLDIGAQARKCAPRDAARAYVFDLWVNQLDHVGDIVNFSNIALGVDDHGANPAFVFFDYEKSMGFLDGKWQPLSVPPPFPPELRAAIDLTEAMDTAAQIQALPEEAIAGVVNRVPAEWLTPTDAEQIIGNLIERKVGVVAALAHHLGATP